MYDAQPTYPVIAGAVGVGYDDLAATVRPQQVVAVDGPQWVRWDELIGGLRAAWWRSGHETTVTDMREHARPWPEIERLTAESMLPGDPDFLRLSTQHLAALLEPPAPAPAPDRGVHLIAGPGAALVDHGLLWYVDVARDLGLEAVRRGDAANLGQPRGQTGDERRLTFVDWPILDRHRAGLVAKVDCMIDLREPARPTWLTGETLRHTLAELAGRPFRTRPHFHAGVWGGQWMRERLGIETDAANLAWSYELIAPEAGIRLGTGEDVVEVALDVLLAVEAERVLGRADATAFGSSFPIRFDYLDTWDGQGLSVHCHPLPGYMQETFGWSYTQHESYYVMETRGDRLIYLGLRDDADLEELRREAEAARDDAEPYDITGYVRTFEARAHQLYLVPAGTPHCSGEGNVVLEVSATPYAYSLRLYDWLRTDLEGSLRPVHVEHALANVGASRRGGAVEELIPQPKVLRHGDGWAEELLGALPELFFEVRRLVFAVEIADATGGHYHVLNLVAGVEVTLVTDTGHHHVLHYAETIIVPASVGPYRLRATGAGASSPTMVVKAQVRDG
ncbi:MAG: class I mannose-6-phosphate isomerase [Egibacteraceae bacterium]